MAESITPQKAGKKTLADRIAEGKASVAAKLAAGWEWTPDGLLSPADIFAAGYVPYPNGAYGIPSEEYISDGNGDRRPGEKYVAASRRYMDWRRQFLYGEKKISEPVKQQGFIQGAIKPVPKNEDEIDVSKIPF